MAELAGASKEANGEGESQGEGQGDIEPELAPRGGEQLGGLELLRVARLRGGEDDQLADAVAGGKRRDRRERQERRGGEQGAAGQGHGADLRASGIG